jgi:hypothetical protein
MKNVIIIIMTIVTFSLKAQEKLFDILPLKNDYVTYSGVVEVDSIDKKDLHKRAKKWFVNNYKSANDVIQLEDIENGEIIGKGYFTISYYTRDPRISHTISIFVKDGRYKYVITDFSYSDNQNEKFPIENFPKSWGGKKKLYLKIHEEVNSIITSIEKFIKTKPVEDW